MDSEKLKSFVQTRVWMKMMNSQSELTVERPRSFIGPSVVEIRGAYLELNLSQTRVQSGTRVRVWKHPTRSSRF